MDDQTQAAEEPKGAGGETIFDQIEADTIFSSGPPSYADVRGDALAEMFKFSEQQAKPVVTGVEDPISGATALIVIDSEGVKALPADVFKDYLDGPRFRQGSATLTSLDSFIAHVNRFADDESVVFADNNRSRPNLTAVLDYHGADDRSQAEVGQPRFGRHRSLFSFPLSDEWQAWNLKNKTTMSMKEFAAFLEDHIVDVMLPHEINLSEQAAKFVDRLGGADRIADPAALMTLAHNFQVFEQSNAGQSVSLSSGEGRDVFETIHVDSMGQPLKVPQMFVLGIPVFKMGALYQVLARLRYRKDGGNIVFFYELWRLDIVFDHAFDEAVKRVEAETNLPVLLGSPEAG